MDFWGILEYTVAVTVIGLFIWLVKLIFHDKLDARWHYFIWLVLLVRLLVPFRFGLISTPIYTGGVLYGGDMRDSAGETRRMKII